MADLQSIESLKATLSEEVKSFCRDDRDWKRPISRTVRELREMEQQSVFFGGTLRSLLTSRLDYHRPGRPRDVDIVMRDIGIETLRSRFHDIVARETRFGGLQLKRVHWQFDIWPLDRTWMFVNERKISPNFADLPSTTFLNLEAIAVEVWPRPGHSRRIYSGDDQFFRGILNSEVEVNREENPHPDLCVVRALILASSLGYRLGPRLSALISSWGARLPEGELERVQTTHYGAVRFSGRILREWIRFIGHSVAKDDAKPVYLPKSRQLPLFPTESEKFGINVRCYSFGHGSSLRSAAQ